MGRGRGSVRRVRGVALAGALGMLSLVTAVSASASVTIGQLAPSAPPPASCVNGAIQEYLQPTGTAANAYVVPATGGVADWTVTSWSHNAAAGAGQSLKAKFYRHVTALTYRAVAQDAVRALAPSVVNTFAPVSPIRVKPGDLIGSADGSSAANACTFLAPGETYLFRTGDLADGQEASFIAAGDGRVNIAAVLDPTNTFSLGDLDRNRKKGTARLTIAGIPNPGELALSGKGIRRASATVAPGEATLRIRAKGKKENRLNQNGKVKVNPEIVYTPTAGSPNTQSRRLKLREKD